MEMEVEERIAKACEKAREEAGDKAREEGREETCRETALRMLGKRYPLEDIALISGLSLAEVRELAEKA
jgi:predicted transposase/invertase (TIGR01784 family)